MRRAVALALIAAGLAWPVAIGPARAATAYDGACTDDAGVTIVVDFQDLGGGVSVRCAPGEPASGLDALDRAGITWTGTLRFPGFVCRIAGQPGPESDPCVNTPPATAYWGYWVAERGGTWCYSTAGAANRKPPPGTVEGWSFAKNRTGNPPAPGYGPPPPAGAPARPLNPADCQSAQAPATTTTMDATASPATTAPSPPAPEPPSSSETDAAAPRKFPAQTAAAAPAAPAGTSTTGAPPPPTETTTATTAAPAEVAATAATAAASDTATSTSTSSSGPATTVRVLGGVDLSNDGRRGGLNPFTVVALLVTVAVVTAGVVVARRRRAAPS